MQGREQHHPHPLRGIPVANTGIPVPLGIDKDLLLGIIPDLIDHKVADIEPDGSIISPPPEPPYDDRILCERRGKNLAPEGADTHQIQSLLKWPEQRIRSTVIPDADRLMACNSHRHRAWNNQIARSLILIGLGKVPGRQKDNKDRDENKEVDNNSPKRHMLFSCDAES